MRTRFQRLPPAAEPTEAVCSIPPRSNRRTLPRGSAVDGRRQEPGTYAYVLSTTRPQFRKTVRVSSSLPVLPVHPWALHEKPAVARGRCTPPKTQIALLFQTMQQGYSVRGLIRYSWREGSSSILSPKIGASTAWCRIWGRISSEYRSRSEFSGFVPEGTLIPNILVQDLPTLLPLPPLRPRLMVAI